MAKSRLDFLVTAADKTGGVLRNHAADLKRIGSVVTDLAKMGATAGRTEQRLIAFAGSTGKANDVLEAFQKGAGGTINKMDSMHWSSRLLQMGLVDNASEMKKFVEMATRLGDQTTNASERIEGFAMMLANQSLPRLDSYGMSAANVRSRINELQKATKEMTREQAFMIAVTEAGGEALDTLGERAEDDAAKFEKAQVAIDDAKLALAQGLAPVVSTVAGLISKLDAQTILMVGSLGLATKGVLALRGQMAALSPQMAAAAGAATFVAAAAASLYLSWQASEKVAAQYEEGMGRVADKTDQLSDKAAQAVASGTDLSDVMGELADKAEAVNEQLHKDGNMLEDFAHARVRAKKEDEIWLELQEEIQDVAVENTEVYEDYIEAIREYNELVGDEKQQVEELTRAQYEQIRSAWSFRDALSALHDQAVAQQASVTEYAAAWETAFGEDQAAAAERYASAWETTLTRQRINTEAAATATAWQSEVAAVNSERLREMKAAAEEAAISQGDLAVKLHEARAEQIASALIDQLDPEKMGSEAYLGMVNEIQIGFGLADEKSTALAGSIGAVADAFNEGLIPQEQAVEFIKAWNDDAEDGKVSTSNLVSEFSDAPPPINDTAMAIEDVDAGMLNVIGTAPEALTAIQEFAGGSRDAIDDMLRLSAAINSVSTAMAGGGGGGIREEGGVPHYQSGGIVPGRGPRLAVVHGGERIIPTGGGGSAGGLPGAQITVVVAPGGFATPEEGGQRAADAYVQALRARGIQV